MKDRDNLEVEEAIIRGLESAGSKFESGQHLAQVAQEGFDLVHILAGVQPDVDDAPIERLAKEFRLTRPIQ